MRSCPDCCIIRAYGDDRNGDFSDPSKCVSFCYYAKEGADIYYQRLLLLQGVGSVCIPKIMTVMNRINC